MINSLVIQDRSANEKHLQTMERNFKELRIYITLTFIVEKTRKPELQIGCSYDVFYKTQRFIHLMACTKFLELKYTLYTHF